MSPWERVEDGTFPWRALVKWIMAPRFSYLGLLMVSMLADLILRWIGWNG